MFYAKQTTTFVVHFFSLSSRHSQSFACFFSLCVFVMLLVYDLGVQERECMCVFCVRSAGRNNRQECFCYYFRYLCVKWVIKTANKSTLGELITILIVSIGYLFYFLFNITSFVFNFIFILFFFPFTDYLFPFLIQSLIPFPLFKFIIFSLPSSVLTCSTDTFLTLLVTFQKYIL